MQAITHSSGYSYLHPIFLEFDNLYRELSNDDATGQLITPVFESSLVVFEDIFNEYGNCIRHLKYADKSYEQIRGKYPKKNIIVGFSGGKDSTATALYFKSKGFNVYLYHVHGLNKFFPQELDTAKTMADKLGLPLIVDSVTLYGKSLYPDHPLKNIIIANMAVQWGIRNNIGVRLAMGDYYTAFLDDVEFATAGDDCVEMWQAYKGVIKKYIPQIKIETPLTNLGATLHQFEENPELLGLAQSCVMTYRFKAKHRERIQNTYGIELLPNRCGCCWKDAVEYIWSVDKGLVPLNKSYYMHCFTVLANAHEKETGFRFYSMQSLWNEYFFYPITESIMYEVIHDAIVQSHGKIVCPNNDTER